MTPSLTGLYGYVWKGMSQAESDPSFGSVTAGAPGGASGRNVVGLAGASGRGLLEAVPPVSGRARGADTNAS